MDGQERFVLGQQVYWLEDAGNGWGNISTVNICYGDVVAMADKKLTIDTPFGCLWGRKLVYKFKQDVWPTRASIENHLFPSTMANK